MAKHTPQHPETAALLGDCESCNCYPAAVMVEMPAMPDYDIPPAVFLLCVPCAEFANELIYSAEGSGISL